MTNPEGIPVAPARPSGQGWAALAIGGFLLTLLFAGLGSQLLMSFAVPGPAAPYAAAVVGIGCLSLVASTLVMGKLVGVRTPGQWVRAFVAVGVPIAVAIATLALTLRPD